MKQYTILEKTIYYDQRSSRFFLFCPPSEFVDSLPSIDILKKDPIPSPTAYSFCLDISDDCNLCCDYCFNKCKSGRRMEFDQACSYLDKLFDLFGDGEKYFVDLSGIGEPLLCLPLIERLAQYCHKKQDEIGKEVLPQLVCNGTLLSKNVAKRLQDAGVLFGVSLDGSEYIHDLHRKDKLGNPTYKKIIDNVLSIENRDYVGCAATLTKDVFEINQAAIYLSNIFNTISFRRARGQLGIDAESEKAYEKEYDKLALTLKMEIDESSPKILRCLMNGDDYFGRFLNLLFGDRRVVTRCDCLISRFAVSIDGRVYGCPAMTNKVVFDSHKILFASKNMMEKQLFACPNCELRLFCGGECQIVQDANKEVNQSLCRLRKHLILLSAYLCEYTYTFNPALAQTIKTWTQEKANRLRQDKELLDFIQKNKGLRFTEAKKKFDALHHRY